jgi:N6-adenosine-specific RNA methylase IME4
MSEISWPGLFDIVIADPPWRYEFSNSKSRDIENAHPTMTMEDIYSIPVSQLAAKDAGLYLWVPVTKVPEGCELVKRWGFKYKTDRDWDKMRVGRGYHARGQHEHVFIATRGKWSPPPAHLRRPSIFRAPRPARYSGAKPDEPQEALEEQYPSARKVELFARRERDKWICLGFDTGWELGSFGARRTQPPAVQEPQPQSSDSQELGLF